MLNSTQKSLFLIIDPTYTYDESIPPTGAQPSPTTSWGKNKEGLYLWEGEMNRHTLSAHLSAAGLS